MCPRRSHGLAWTARQSSLLAGIVAVGRGRHSARPDAAAAVSSRPPATGSRPSTPNKSRVPLRPFAESGPHRLALRAQGGPQGRAAPRHDGTAAGAGSPPPCCDQPLSAAGYAEDAGRSCSSRDPPDDRRLRRRTSATPSGTSSRSSARRPRPAVGALLRGASPVAEPHRARRGRRRFHAAVPGSEPAEVKTPFPACSDHRPPRARRRGAARLRPRAIARRRPSFRRP